MSTPTREQAIDAAGRALAEIAKDIRRKRRKAQIEPKPAAEQQADAA